MAKITSFLLAPILILLFSTKTNGFSIQSCKNNRKSTQHFSISRGIASGGVVTSTRTHLIKPISDRVDNGKDGIKDISTSAEPEESSRRKLLVDGVVALSSFMVYQSGMDTAYAATGEDEVSTNGVNLKVKPTSEAEVTSKIFITLKGLPPPPESSDGGSTSYVPNEDKIVIGLFGNEAPKATQILQQLVSNSGYPAKCKPRESRTLQREQLEANKVFNACMETQDVKGVTYDLSTVWRVVKDYRIDLGAVSGKFVSRIPPNFQVDFDDDATSTATAKRNYVLAHDSEGIVSVRRGDDGGFGFTIYPGTGGSSGDKAAKDLDKQNIVVESVGGYGYGSMVVSMCRVHLVSIIRRWQVVIMDRSMLLSLVLISMAVRNFIAMN